MARLVVSGRWEFPRADAVPFMAYNLSHDLLVLFLVADMVEEKEEPEVGLVPLLWPWGENEEEEGEADGVGTSAHTDPDGSKESNR